MSRAATCARALALAAVLASCGGREAEAPRPDEATNSAGWLAEARHALGGLEAELPEAGRGTPTSAPATEQPCDEAAGTTPGDADGAIVPLVEGLTLASTWWGEAGSDDDYEHECLTHVVRVDAREVVLSSSCPTGRERTLTRGVRRVCRADLERGSIYIAQRGPNSPEMVTGSTADLLSRASYRELRSGGSTTLRAMRIVRHDPLARLLDMARGLAGGGPLDGGAAGNAADFVVEADASGVVRTLARETEAVDVNGRRTTLPVLRAAGPMQPSDGGAPRPWRLAVLDDERAPWVLDNLNEATGARIRIDRITYPVAETLERELASERQATLHGVYFELGSDALREESMPVLAEAAEVLRRHPEWRLAVHGHTDNVGGDAYNRQLSERRAAAVRRVLVERFAIDAARLEAQGFGASQPQDANDTPEGRARNRRVELVRR